jgi:hypothetical protein
MLVVLWLPATLHCDFEAVGLDTVFHCESDHHSPTEKPITDDSCDVVENGWIKLSNPQSHVAAPLLSVCFLCCSAPALEELLAPPEIALSDVVVAPLHIGRTWHFVTRASLPARAPSLFV